AAGYLGQCLQVLVGEQFGVWPSQVDRFEYGADGFGLPLGDEYLGLPLPFGGEDGALLGAFGGEDLRLAAAFGGEDGGPLVPFGAQLLLHRVLDRAGWVDGFQLDPVDPDAPLPGGLVQDPAQFGVDLLAGGERAFQVHAPDHVAQRGHGQLLDGLDEVGDLVGGRPRIGDLEVQDRVDMDDQVVLGDDRLGRERHDLLSQVDPGPDPVDERDHGVQACVEGPAVGARPFDDIGAGPPHV